MKNQRNYGVAYSGKVTGKMRPFPKSKGCTLGLRRVVKHLLLTNGGPMHGHRLALADVGSTLPISMNGQVGRYVQSSTPGVLDWQAA